MIASSSFSAYWHLRKDNTRILDYSSLNNEIKFFLKYIITLQKDKLDALVLRNLDFSQIDLTSDSLNQTNLSSADLSDAKLSSADFRGADLRVAILRSADLSGAILINNKYLTFYQIKSACFWDQAKYKGNRNDKQEKWIVNEKANQKYIEQLKQDKSSDPKIKPDCDRWNTL